MKKLSLILGFLVLGFVGISNADSIGYFTTSSTGVAVTTSNRINVVGYSVSTGSAGYFILIDTVAFGQTMGTSGPTAGFTPLGTHSVASWLTPPIVLFGTTTVMTPATTWLPGDGISVEKGLFIFGSAAGLGTITVYTKPNPIR